jgi:hypothetical protein
LDLLEVGEPQVSQHTLEWAKFLCAKSKVGYLMGDMVMQEEAFTQAQKIADEQKKPQDHPLRKIIAQTRAYIGRDKSS